MRTAVAWFERIGTALAVLISLLFMAAIGGVVLAVHSGYQAAAMETGSMAPAIRVGDMAVLQKTTPESIHVGDTITFAAPVAGNPLVTHRVVKIEQTTGGPVFTTKGDANAAPDQWTVHYSGSAWKVVRVLPSAGAAFDFMQGTGGRIVIGVLIFVIVLALLAPAPSSSSRPRATGAAA